ncbi:uncharacterized protein LOC135809092 [Sycon ciliatum]|uniref:uncharacterized protein LOC135809092 n=1 Tax=Sycon ciliatum TaxID=27933 RepID=UPI0020A9F112|eukprot:scpid89282/ scgid30378/ Peptidyl-prolyl cis-trans isomerase FKBP14; FK506-binding protein 14; Rotamase
MWKFVVACLCLAVVVRADDGLVIDTLFKPEDCGEVSKSGDSLGMNYKGTLASNGEVFDESRPGSPFTFTIGAGQVIQGWDRGLLDMCVGEKRKLTIPPALGYGDQGAGKIPAGATLIFEVELLSLNEAAPDAAGGEAGLESLFKGMDKDNSGGIDKEEIKIYLNSQGGFQGEENIDDIVEEIFKAEDKNNDQLLTLDEFGPDNSEPEVAHDAEEL